MRAVYDYRLRIARGDVKWVTWEDKFVAIFGGRRKYLKHEEVLRFDLVCRFGLVLVDYLVTERIHKSGKCLAGTLITTRFQCLLSCTAVFSSTPYAYDRTSPCFVQF